MSEWKKVKLGEVCERVTSGGTPKANISSYYNPPTIPWLKTKEVNYCRITETENYISEEGLNNSSAKMISPNSVIIAMYGQGDTAGRVAINKIPLTTNQACCNLTIDEHKADYEFIYYQLCTLYNKMVSLKAGAAQPNLNAQIIKNLEILLPVLPIQHRIATILSRYDSLIENYQKQIKLLEEAAQRLYKEWFVDLRFPGHENTKIVDGVPEGWRKGILDDIAYESGKKVDKKNRDCYNYYLPIDCLPKHSLTYLTFADISLAESSLVSFEENDIIFGAMRPYFHKVCFAQSNGLTRTTCFVLNSKENEYREYLLMLLFEDSTVKHATSISVGTTMPYTRWKEFKSMEIVIPVKEIAIAFGKQISRITNVLNKLSSQIRLLTEARDRLLPKLMSGEIAV